MRQPTWLIGLAALLWGAGLLGALLWAGVGRAEPRRLAFVFDPPAPIVMPLRIEAAGLTVGDVYVRDDMDVASVNAMGSERACYTLVITDASGQQATFQDRRDCGLTVWLPWIEQP